MINIHSKSLNKDKCPLSLVISEITLGFFIGLLAIVTILTHLSQNFQIRFKVYSFLVLLSFLFFLLKTCFDIYKKFRQKIFLDRNAALFLLFMGITCSLLALFSYRWDGDDTFYIPNVIYMLDHPDDAMGFEIHSIELEKGCKLFSYSWATAMPFEYMQGAFAHIFKLKFFTIYYLISPSVIGFLIPLALYFALSQFSESSPENIVLSAFLTIMIVLLLGETHRTYGNFSLTRAYQGKTLLLSIGIPYFVGASINFFETPSINYWFTLIFITVAMVGATASAIPVLLVLAMVLLLSFLMSVNIRKQKMNNFLIYLASLFYIGLYALFLLQFSKDLIDIESPVNQAWPSTFHGQLDLMINYNQPLTPIVIGISSLLSIFLTRGVQRKMLCWWMVFVIFFCLNPIVAPLYIKYLISPNVYWRMFYIFPYSIVIGISINEIIDRIKFFSTTYQKIVGLLILLIFIGAYASPASTSTFHYNHTFHIPPVYKLPIEQMKIVEDINLYAPAGAILAPQDLAGYIIMVNSNYPQFTRYSENMYTWMKSCSYTESAISRILQASSFVSGDLQYKTEFYDFLNNEGANAQSILIHKNSYWFDDVQIYLEQLGFSNLKESKDYFILWKTVN